MIENIFRLSESIRYVAVYRNEQLESMTEPRIHFPKGA